ncbi:hypothetical protein [Mesorhizobium salmacidum]|uniref:Uncharacterized protein n=1 Tax=Mesorhizobium salmacidum TaxID=3015171 RepID=A0ABU8KZZ9_9HYPH
MDEDVAQSTYHKRQIRNKKRSGERHNQVCGDPMPRKTKRQKQPDEEHTHLAIRVERYEASVEAAINYNVYTPQTAWSSDDDDPLYRFISRLTVAGLSTYPEERAGDTYEITVYGDNLGSGDIRATLKDVQERDQHGSVKYRQYRGTQIPIYNPPPGIGLIDKIRGEPRWTAWLRVSPHYTSDALALLRNGRDGACCTADQRPTGACTDQRASRHHCCSTKALPPPSARLIRHRFLGQQEPAPELYTKRVPIPIPDHSAGSGKRCCGQRNYRKDVACHGGNASKSSG